MPNVWTHNIYGEQIAKESGIDIANYKNIFHLGCQGPDPFFYHNFWPWKKDKSLSKIGSLMHRKHCGMFFTEMVKYAKENLDDEMLKYYVLGFIAHHLLDRNTHPYIIYNSGHGNAAHTKLEVIIDTIYAKKYQGIETWKTPVFKEIDIGTNLPDSVIEMLNYLLKKVYNIELDTPNKLINEAYRHMVKALKIFYDPLGIKNKLLGRLISSYSYTKSYPDRDYLNLNKQEWNHPAYLEEKNTASFDELFANAIVEGSRIFNLIIAYFNDEETIDTIKEDIADISYETGKPSELELELQYYKPIL